MNDPDFLALSQDDRLQALLLESQIHALRAARDCACHPSTTQQVYGRIDGLINDRQDQLLHLVARATAATARTRVDAISAEVGEVLR